MAEYSLPQVRGVLLEEALAALLSRTGFRIITSATGDPTLATTPAGLAVKGRGTQHQIDVIADFRFTAPFTNPNRLLVEAKFHDRTIGLDVVRNTAGILRDVAEWFLPQGNTHGHRYHYQGAVFSASKFSQNAQRFAYAHDIVLIPLRGNTLFRPVLRGIEVFSEVRQATRTLRLRDIRATARSRLLRHGDDAGSTENLDEALDAIVRSIDSIGNAYLARTRGGFALFLVAESVDDAQAIVRRSVEPMRVRYRRQEGWWLEFDEPGGPRLSFDLPQELFRVYQKDGRLDREGALRMKLEEFEEIHAYRYVAGRVETLILRLDEPWIDSVRQALDEGGR